MPHHHTVVPVRRKNHDGTVVPVRRNIHDGDISFPNGTHEDGALCSHCGARYHNHHWVLSATATTRNGTNGAAKNGTNGAAKNGTTGKASAGGHRVLCPACRKAEEKDPGGIVRLSGDYWPQHRDEILNLIRNEEKKAMGMNPVERILRIDEDDGHLVIQTTNEKLAQRLGRAIHKACHGDVEYKWSDETKLVRVEWRR